MNYHHSFSGSALDHNDNDNIIDLKERSETEFPVHSSTHDSGTDLNSSPNSSSAVAADVVQRLRDYAEDRLVTNKADEIYRRGILRQSIRQWHKYQQQHHPQHTIQQQLYRSYRHHRLHWSIQQWYQYIESHRILTSHYHHLDHFYHRHLQHRCFNYWVQYVLHRKDRQVSQQLSSSLYRANLLRDCFHLWIHYHKVTSFQNALQRQADGYARNHLLSDALLSWVTESHTARIQHDKEKKADVIGNQHRRRYAWNRWIAFIQYIHGVTETIPIIEQIDDNHLLRTAWYCWINEGKWMKTAARSIKTMESLTRQSTLIRTIDQWRQHVDYQQQEQTWNSIIRLERPKIQQRAALSKWREFILNQRADRWFNSKLILRQREALTIWHHVYRLLCDEGQSNDHYKRHLIYSCWIQWREQYAVERRERQQLSDADNYHQHRIISTTVQHWLFISHSQYYRESRQIAAIHHQRSQAASAIDAFKDHLYVRYQRRHHRQLTKHFRMHQFVLLLQRHAAKERERWQHYLQGKRFHYRHLLLATWQQWNHSIQELQAAEDRLFSCRAQPLLMNIQNMLFNEWRRRVAAVQNERRMEIVAIMKWKRHLLHAVMSEWITAKYIAVKERDQMSLATRFYSQLTQHNMISRWNSQMYEHQDHRYERQQVILYIGFEVERQKKRRIWKHWCQRKQLVDHLRTALNTAVSYDRHQLLSKRTTQWQIYAERHHQRCYAKQQAIHRYNETVLSASFSRWCALFNLRRHLLQLHIRARDHRTKRLMKLVWAGWEEHHQQKKSKRQREQQMKQMRLHRLRVEGSRQWMMMGMEWLKQKENEQKKNTENFIRLSLEQGIANNKPSSSSTMLSSPTPLPSLSIARISSLVIKIADYWHRRTMVRRRKDFHTNNNENNNNTASIIPLLTAEQVDRWKRRKEKLSSHLLGHSDIPHVMAVVNHQPKQRTEPRRHIELLVESEMAAKKKQNTESAATAISIPMLSLPIVISHLDANTVDALEERLLFLSDLYQSYQRNKRELSQLERQINSSLSVVSADNNNNNADISALNDRYIHLLQTCLSYEQHRSKYREEVSALREWMQQAQKIQIEQQQHQEQQERAGINPTLTSQLQAVRS